MIFTPPFGHWIAQRRKTLDMTQADLARVVGYSLSTIRRIETGDLSPSRMIADQLTIALDIPQGTRSDFLAFARGLETRHRISNLPVPVSSILGRQDDAVAAAATLVRDDVRLLTLTGPPGVGKTRLAVEVAHSLDSDFADGVCFVALAQLASADLVESALLKSLGGLYVVGEAVVDTLAQRLVDKHLLLVLDNFEHLLPAASLVAELLARTTKLKVMATSRAPLHIGGETIYDVSPLRVPDLSHLPHASELCSWPAVDLFVRRAQQVKASFHLTQANAYAVAWLCCSLDGLPLAIELAAARVRAFTPQTIMTRLDHHLGSRLQLLSVGMQDMPPRQQTLCATIDWSYNLLSAEEQRMFLRLGVFAGGCTLEAIHAVCDIRVALDSGPVSLEQFVHADGTHLSETVNLIQSLVDKCLVQHVEGVDGESRYSMLETIREYALQHMEASNDAVSIRRRHACYFASKCQLDLNSPDWPIVCTGHLKGFARERDNLYAAMGWCKGYVDEPMLHLWISIIVGWLTYTGNWYMGVQGDARIIESEIDWSLERNPGISPAQRSMVLQTRGLLLQRLGDYEEAARIESEGLTLSLSAGTLGIAASAAHACGHNANAAGELELAERYYMQQRELGERISAPGWVLNGLSMVGYLALERGDLDRAAGLLKQALALARSLGIRTDILGGQAVVLQNMGLLAYEQGDHNQAYELGYQALLLFEEEGEMLRHFTQHLNLGRAALAQQSASLAEQHLLECLRIAREYGLNQLTAMVYLAQVAALQGDRLRYARLMGAASGAWLPDTRLWSRLAMSEQQQCHAAMTEAKGHLSMPAFAAAWAEGQAMTIEQAVAYTLQESETVKPPMQ